MRRDSILMELQEMGSVSLYWKRVLNGEMEDMHMHTHKVYRKRASEPATLAPEVKVVMQRDAGP